MAERGYGAMEEAEAESMSARRQTRNTVAAVTAALATVCLLTIVVSSQMLDSKTVLDQVNEFQTPTLKSLLGTFMHEQGASKKDISEMNNYYKGASKKAPFQMLDDISGEFDPIVDADSNYGRVLDIKSVSRTNGAIPEDMDVSPERKAPVQMLYDVDGPQMSDPRKASLAKSAINHHFHRQMTKQEMLRKQIQEGILGTADKAPVQMLDDISGEFDPISDADSNYGRVLDIKSVSRTNG
eukprot:CAMPEP_0181307274 /NCGR_PEP_ID=MMETSP1101-20121128/10779_1 /TAXON_ID=46948 /ORGANISM="Rhodomonas abbreviata, Strain Caron Lab Isolate" /LENGTH=239 /DNA_ID=CAMNT_0023413453 /DNA_START=9 /DNA_END=724 /DNA_ORIENTATION=+